MKRLLLVVCLFLFASHFSFAYDSTSPVVDSVRSVTPATVTYTIKTTVDSTKKAAAPNCSDIKQTTLGCTLAWIVIALVILSFLWLAVKSNMLRDSVNNPQLFLENAQKLNPAKYGSYTVEEAMAKIPRSFSLSRSQLGIWIAIIACAYIFLSLCKFWGITIVFNNTALVLLGISAATAVAGNVIDKSQESNECRHQNTPSQGFFYDILSDQFGISVHRFQNVVWTLIAAIIYICKINSTACGFLPDLDSTLIALSGISNATYLGLKINENAKAVQ